ncbi:hypothetical protein D3C77_818830 [compost metagenome]
MAITFSTAPLARRLSSILAFSSGKGQFSPLASSSASQVRVSLIAGLSKGIARLYLDLAG